MSLCPSPIQTSSAFHSVSLWSCMICSRHGFLSGCVCSIAVLMHSFCLSWLVYVHELSKCCVGWRWTSSSFLVCYAIKPQFYSSSSMCCVVFVFHRNPSCEVHQEPISLNVIDPSLHDTLPQCINTRCSQRYSSRYTHTSNFTHTHRRWWIWLPLQSLQNHNIGKCESARWRNE